MPLIDTDPNRVTVAFVLDDDDLCDLVKGYRDVAVGQDNARFIIRNISNNNGPEIILNELLLYIAQECLSRTLPISWDEGLTFAFYYRDDTNLRVTSFVRSLIDIIYTRGQRHYNRIWKFYTFAIFCPTGDFNYRNVAKQYTDQDHLGCNGPTIQPYLLAHLIGRSYLPQLEASVILQALSLKNDTLINDFQYEPRCGSLTLSKYDPLSEPELKTLEEIIKKLKEVLGKSDPKAYESFNSVLQSDLDNSVTIPPINIKQMPIPLGFVDGTEEPINVAEFVRKQLPAILKRFEDNIRKESVPFVDSLLQSLDNWMETLDDKKLSAWEQFSYSGNTDTKLSLHIILNLAEAYNQKEFTDVSDFPSADNIRLDVSRLTPGKNIVMNMDDVIRGVLNEMKSKIEEWKKTLLEYKLNTKLKSWFKNHRETLKQKSSLIDAEITRLEQQIDLAKKSRIPFEDYLRCVLGIGNIMVNGPIPVTAPFNFTNYGATKSFRIFYPAAYGTTDEEIKSRLNNHTASPMLNDQQCWSLVVYSESEVPPEDNQQ